MGCTTTFWIPFLDIGCFGQNIGHFMDLGGHFLMKNDENWQKMTPAAHKMSKICAKTHNIQKWDPKCCSTPLRGHLYQKSASGHLGGFL